MYLVGVACAFVSGYFAIYFLRLVVQRGKNSAVFAIIAGARGL